MGDFNAGVIEEFRANGGRVGGPFEGYPLILIHHVGARTGVERVTPVGCFARSDDRLVIIASNGGARDNPDWYYNVKAHPEVGVEFGAEAFVVEVRELEGDRARTGVGRHRRRGTCRGGYPERDQPHDPRPAAHAEDPAQARPVNHVGKGRS